MAFCPRGLVYSRVSREAITLEPIDLESLLNQIIVERPEFQPPKAKVKLDLPLATVSAHEAYLTQCITNLLDNAVKFVPADRTPEVTIWTESRDGKVCFCFEDNGPGIPEKARERIFGIFQQIHSDDTFSGTGIGLAIVRRAVERMGGRYILNPRPLKGRAFVSNFPHRNREQSAPNSSRRRSRGGCFPPALHLQPS